jgi:uncharacterized protein (UPF0261 family)
MEELAVEDMLDAIFDLSTHEITDEIFGGIHAGDSNRLLAGGVKGVPRLVVPGALDLITLGRPETIPQEYRSQPNVPHNPNITLVRLSKEQMIQVGNVLVERLNQANAPVIVAIPRGGYSFYNKDGLHFRDLEADRAFVRTLKDTLKPDISLQEIDGHINDPEFVEGLLEVFETLLERADLKHGK